MARLASVVVPGYPHYITQRGSRRQETFFGNDDYRTYIELMAEAHRRYTRHVNFREGWRGCP